MNPLDDFPRLIRKAVVLIEDRRFYSHHGIDLVAILRAVVTNFRERRYAQGGSTITQQLARTFYLSGNKTLRRKLAEVVIAVWLEFTMSKHEILRSYLDQVYMGHRKDGSVIKGFEEASLYYFSIPINETSPREQAMLVGMLKGPNVFRPGTPRGRIRQTLVLTVMAENGIISHGEFDHARRCL